MKHLLRSSLKKDNKILTKKPLKKKVNKIKAQMKIKMLLLLKFKQKLIWDSQAKTKMILYFSSKMN